MNQTEQPIKSPDSLAAELVADSANQENISRNRAELRRIIERSDKRLAVIAGPCSIHNIPAAMEYAEKLAKLAERVSDEVKVVMRCYFEKPRTTLGWKGLVYDPALDGGCDIARGLELARKLLLDVSALGLGTATELLDPAIANYLAELVSWAGIGARTTESQTHRQLASALDMPVGFKNSTDGNLQIAVDAICAARAPHSFIGIMHDGRSGIIRSNGNPNCHLVLRGGISGENYYPACIAAALRKLENAGIPRTVMIDCSHGNSRRDPARQHIVFEDVLAQKLAGNDGIAGMMLESCLLPGKQNLIQGVTPDPRISVTDACIGFDETERIILAAAERLRHGTVHFVSTDRPKVAYLGPAGTFTHEAARKVFSETADYRPYSGIQNVFRAVESGECEFACVPVENTTEGVVIGTLDVLAETPLKIYAETSMNIHHCLMASVPKEKIGVIYSHIQSLGQCRKYLERNFPDVETVGVGSNARAAEFAALSPNAAVIGGENIAAQYHLNILDRSIEDAQNNRTRFLVLSKGENNLMPHAKCCICFTALERFGALHDCLEPFKNAGVTLTMIESRPSGSGCWRYRFFVDIEGAAETPKVAAALSDLKPLTEELKILGSYPVI